MTCRTTEERYLPQVIHLEQVCTFKSTGRTRVRVSYFGGTVRPNVTLDGLNVGENGGERAQTLALHKGKQTMTVKADVGNYAPDPRLGRLSPAMYKVRKPTPSVQKLLYPGGFRWRAPHLDPKHYFEPIPLVNDEAGIAEVELAGKGHPYSITLSKQIFVPADNGYLNFVTLPPEEGGNQYVAVKFK